MEHNVPQEKHSRLDEGLLYNTQFSMDCALKDKFGIKRSDKSLLSSGAQQNLKSEATLFDLHLQWKEDIKDALWSMAAGKSPGGYGLPKMHPWAFIKNMNGEKRMFGTVCEAHEHTTTRNAFKEGGTNFQQSALATHANSYAQKSALLMQKTRVDARCFGPQAYGFSRYVYSTQIMTRWFSDSIDGLDGTNVEDERSNEEETSFFRKC
eukprot:Gb_29652 [translate_table: standard]